VGVQIYSQLTEATMRDRRGRLASDPRQDGADMDNGHSIRDLSMPSSRSPYEPAAALQQFKLMLQAHWLRIAIGGGASAGEAAMSVVTILGVVAAALVLLSVGGVFLLMRKFDRIYDGLE
jgi:hypothetical protein